MKRILMVLLALVLCLSAFAACAPDPATEADLKNATAFLKDKYKSLLTTPETAVDFDLVTTVVVGGVNYSVTWTVDNEAVKVVAGEGKVTIDVDEKSEAEVAYNLTAVVSADDGTKGEPLVFKLKVPKFAVLSFEQYMAAKENDVVVIEGIVAAMNSQSYGNKRDHLFLVDKEGKGGYYCYIMTEDPVKTGIKVGMTVSVSGTVAPYSGMQEIKNCTATIVDSTIKEVAPVDLTAAFTSGADLKNYVGMLVTVKGVEIGAQELGGTSEYLFFSIGETKNAYLRTYVTDMALGASEEEKNAAKATIDAAHAEKFGWTANVTGILVLYSGNPYLIPVGTDCFEYLQLVEKTDAEKMAYEKENLDIPEEVKIDGTVIDLPLKGTAYENVAITWTSDNACAVIDPETGKLTITLQSEEKTVKLTATLKIGELTETVEFTFKTGKKPTIAPQVVEAPEAGKAYKFFLTQENRGELLYLNGKMDGYYFATTTKHEEAVDVYLETVDGGYKFYFMDGTAKKYIAVVRGMGDDGQEHDNVKFLDTTDCVWAWNAELKTLTTALSETDTVFLGTRGDKNYSTISASDSEYADTNFVAYLAVMVDAASVSDADKVATEKDALNVSTSISTELELPAAGVTYTDVTISWAAEGAGATIANGKLTVVQTSEEQTVTLTATIKSGEATDTKVFTIKVLAAAAKYTLTEANALEDGVIAIVSGVIVEFKGSKGDNVIISDGTVTFVVYSPANLADLGLGDTITVEGAIGSYNGTKQIAKGATATIDTDHSVAGCTYTTLANKCDICGAVTEHTHSEPDANNKCTLCGELLVIPEYTCADANELADGVQATVKGTITKISGDNFTITDATGTFVIYKPTNKADLGLGDKITVTGTTGSYKGTKQIAAGATAVIDEDHSAGACTYPETGLTAICTICGEVKDHTCVDADTDTKCDACGNDMPVAGEETSTYDFSTYTVGVQYAEETHKLDDTLTMKINKCHLNGELRIYSSSSNDGVAIFESTKVITKVAFNAGNKADTLNVYGSTNGTDWTLIEGVAVTSAYADHTVTIENSTYKFIKLDVAGTQQIRLKTLTVTYVAE